MRCSEWTLLILLASELTWFETLHHICDSVYTFPGEFSWPLFNIPVVTGWRYCKLLRHLKAGSTLIRILACG